MSDTRPLRPAESLQPRPALGRLIRAALLGVATTAALFVAPATSHAAGCSEAALFNTISEENGATTTYASLTTHLRNSCSSGATIPAGTVVDLTVTNLGTTRVQIKSAYSSAYAVSGPTAYIYLAPGATQVFRYRTTVGVAAGRQLGMMVFATRKSTLAVSEQLVSTPAPYLDSDASNNSWSGTWRNNTWTQ